MHLPVRVTPRAFERLREINAESGFPAPKKLRVAVDGGGCSGFQYRISLEGEAGPDDTSYTEAEQEVIIDSVSMPFLAGAEIDFEDELVGARFIVKNPNAASSCGCGISFSI